MTQTANVTIRLLRQTPWSTSYGNPNLRISVDVDSDVTSDTGVTAGSRQTISGGWGVYEAAQDAKAQLLDSRLGLTAEHMGNRLTNRHKIS